MTRRVGRALRRTALFCVFGMFGGPSSARAQSDSVLAHRMLVNDGARVRIVFRRTGELIEGTLVRQAPDTLLIRRDGHGAAAADTLIVAADVLSVERWASHHTVHGAAAGFGLGLLTGVPIGFVAVDRDIAQCKRRPNNDMCGLEVIAFPFYVLGSGVVGLVAGIVHTSHRWERARGVP